MKIIVDELPYNCESCMFKDYDMLRRYCTLSKLFTDGNNDNREEHCPLVEFSEIIKQMKKA